MSEQNNVNVHDIFNVGCKVLINALGTVGFARFMRQAVYMKGDYTAEKYQRSQPTMDEILAELGETVQ